MADKRMFSKSIIDSDAFLEMPLSSQSLYFHLSMRADDEGFINNAKRIMRMIGASEDDMKILCVKKFVILFESGIVVIKHWRINNYLRNDRTQKTNYIDEKRQLALEKNGSYKLTEQDTEPICEVGIPNDNQMSTKCLPNDNQLSTSCPPNDNQVPVKCQHRLDKNRLDKNRLKNIYSEVIEYLNAKTGKHFRITDSVKRLINGRLAEGYDAKDFIKVIDNMNAKWKDTKWEQYLRPITLFAPTKFDGYLNVTVTAKQPDGYEAILAIAKGGGEK